MTTCIRHFTYFFHPSMIYLTSNLYYLSLSHLFFETIRNIYTYVTKHEHQLKTSHESSCLFASWSGAASVSRSCERLVRRVWTDVQTAITSAKLVLIGFREFLIVSRVGQGWLTGDFGAISSSRKQ